MNIGVILSAALALAPPSSVFRTPVTAQGSLEASVVDTIEARVDARLQDPRYELRVPDDPNACKDADCWRSSATAQSARYILEFSVDATEADQRLSVSITDLAEGESVVALHRTCELCGREELFDAASDLTATALRKLDAHASVISTLVIDSVPPGAIVRIDGAEAGTTPLELDVAPGEHVVELSADGYEPLSESVDVERGVHERLRLSMLAETPPTPTPTPTSADATGAMGQPRRGRVIAGAVLVGGGLAGLAAGVTLLVLHGRPITSSCSGADVDLDGDCHYLHDTRIGGAVGIGVGGAALITGSVLLGLELGRKRSSAVSIRPTGTGAVVQGRF